ncbi:Gamma-tubulin complex component 4, partial [Phytophthora palmivora]
MHHELFLALLGHTGDVVERRVDGFFINKEASFLSQAQKSVLERLLRLGFAFSTLEQFVRQAPKLPSVYLHALAQGVEQLLHRYADAIVELEAKTLRASAVFPISNLMFELEEFMEVLPEVCGLVRRLITDTRQEHHVTCVKGAKLLSLVYQRTSSGFPRVRKCMEELLYSCHRVLLKQMMTWMVYGEIVDPHKEFFIKKMDGNAGVGTDKLMQDKTAAVMWHQQFAMDLEAVPLDYFPTSIAESVFVIGKAV